MDTNNLDFIRQAVLFTKQNNLAYKKVFASGPAPNPFYAIKVISVDPNDPNTDFETLEQDKDYYITTFLTDGTEDWNTWSAELGNKGWFILSAREVEQKGTKQTSSIIATRAKFIPGNSAGFGASYTYRTEFLNPTVDLEQKRFMGVPFNIPKYDSEVGEASGDYRGVSTTSGAPDRDYSGNNSNLIQNHFLNLSDKNKIILGWSGGPFEQWWENVYSQSVVSEENEFDPMAEVDNPAAVSILNQKVPLRADYSDPNYQLFYRDKKQEYDNNKDANKGAFTIPIPTDDEVLFYGLSGLETFYNLALEPTLTKRDIDELLINNLISKLKGAIKISQTEDEMQSIRDKKIKEDEAKALKWRKMDYGGGLLSSLIKKVDK